MTNDENENTGITPVAREPDFTLKAGVLTFTDWLKILLAVMVGVVLAVAVLNLIEDEWASLPVTPAETEEEF